MGVYLVARGAGTRMLGVGLLLTNVWGFVVFMLNKDMLRPSIMEDNRALIMVVSMAGTLLMLLGIYRLIAGGGAGLLGQSKSESTAEITSLLIPRNDTNTISRAIEARDAAMALLTKIADERQLKHIPQKSEMQHSTIWGRLDFINHPDPSDATLSLRTVLEIFVERLDFHSIELLYTVRVTVGAKAVTHTGLHSITTQTATRILDSIQNPGRTLRLPNKIRQLPWQLWRPRNKMRRVRRDWETTLLTAGCALLFLIPYVGPVLGILGFVGIGYRTRRRPLHTLTTGKPFSDPRILTWMDSWQVTVRDLGAATANTATGITTRLRKDAPPELLVALERTGYWSTDGRVERDQYMVRYRRSLGFIQVVPYGSNLYVSWECHLNHGAWAEVVVASGVDRESGLNVVANRSSFGSQPINEYDLADANFLTEWMHQAVKTELQIQIAEHHIDQEIDFTINRESRKDALGSSGSKKDDGISPPGTKKKKLFNRVG